MARRVPRASTASSSSPTLSCVCPLSASVSVSLPLCVCVSHSPSVCLWQRALPAVRSASPPRTAARVPRVTTSSRAASAALTALGLTAQPASVPVCFVFCDFVSYSCFSHLRLRVLRVACPPGCASCTGPLASQCQQSSLFAIFGSSPANSLMVLCGVFMVFYACVSIVTAVQMYRLAPAAQYMDDEKQQQSKHQTSSRIGFGFGAQIALSLSLPLSPRLQSTRPTAAAPNARPFSCGPDSYWATRSFNSSCSCAPLHSSASSSRYASLFVSRCGAALLIVLDCRPTTAV